MRQYIYFQNSIRHNLSLHQKFLKIPNEDAGKSSWWTINPENKPVVKQKRRSTYGDCKEKIKKRASDVVKSRGRLMKSSSTSLAPYSTETFRHRSNSSASSCDETSRLSADDTVLCPSPYRQRSYSNASSASQSSLAQEYSQCYSVRSYTDDLNSDFDNIKLDDLSLGSDFIKEYLSPKRETRINIEEEMICEDVTEKKETQSVTVEEY